MAGVVHVAFLLILWLRLCLLLLLSLFLLYLYICVDADVVNVVIHAATCISVVVACL